MDENLAPAHKSRSRSPASRVATAAVAGAGSDEASGATAGARAADDDESALVGAEFVDVDGDKVRFFYNTELGQVQQLLNGRLEVRNVRYFHISIMECKFKDVGGFGHFREESMDADVRRLTEFFSSLSVKVDFKVEDRSSL